MFNPREFCVRVIQTTSSKAPFGYYNDRLAKVCLPDSSTKDIVVFIFKTYAAGAYSINEVRELAKQKGLTIKKQQFINKLSNHFYMGKLLIKAYEDEPEHSINGIHHIYCGRR